MAHSAAKSIQIAQAVARSAAGASQEVIAAEMGVSRTTVQRWLSSPEADAHAADAVDKAREALLDATGGAVLTLVEICADGEARHADRLTAAKAILDRGGLGPGSKVEHSGHLGDMDDAEFVERLREAVELLEPDDG